MGGRLRVGIVHELDNLDPHHALDHISVLVQRQVFESLYRRSEGRAVPDLLVRGLRGVDGGFEAQVRESVRFSDGSALTAERACASLRRCPALPDDVVCSASGATLRLESQRDKPELLEMLSSPTAAIMIEVQTPAGPAILGTGPFAVETQARGSVHLVRNPHHAGSRPSLDSVEFISFPSQRDLGHALARGELDFTTMLPPGELPKGSYVRSNYLPTPSTAILWINVERVADPRIRRAIAHGIDRDRLQQLSYPGAAGLGAAGVAPRNLGEHADSLGHDPDESRRLLELAGVELPLRLRMRTIWASRPYLPSPLDCAAEIAKQLARVGVEIEFEAVADPLAWRRTMTLGDFDLALGGWYADDPSLGYFLTAIYGSDNIPADDGRLLMGCNFSRWRNERADRLLAKIRSNAEASAGPELAELVRAEAPIVALHHGAMTVALGSRIRGREFDELAFPVFSSFTVWEPPADGPRQS